MSDQHTRTSAGETREARIGRVLDEYLRRRARGEVVSEAALLTQHPDLAADLREHLEMLRDLRPPADRIEDLIAQGVLAESSDPRYPAELGAYKITGFIGRGGMGVVLKAHEPSLDRAVALKILRPELASDAAALVRFEREAKAAAALRHPNIVTVYAVGVERGHHFIAMEHVEGPSLGEVIRSANVASGLRPSRTEPRPSGSGWEGEAPAEPSPRGTAVSTVQDAGKDTADTAVPHTLAPLGRESLLGPEMIRSIFRQLLTALAAAHDAGLIHRDVKSSNILLDRWSVRAPSVSAGPTREGAGIGEQGIGSTERGTAPEAAGHSERSEESRSDGTAGDPTRCPTAAPQSPIVNRQSPIPEPRTLNPEPLVKLADFGLARMVTATTRVTLGDSVLGTPEYMSPEQARGDADIDHRTDLYSAGVVLYEMLTGRTPFRADTPTATIHQILHDAPPDPRKLDKTVDRALASLALRLLAKRPEDRFASATRAIQALDRNEAVRPPIDQGQLYRLAGGVLAFLLVVVGAWVALRAVLRPLEIGDMRIDPDTRRAVQARYADDPAWRIWKDFDEDLAQNGRVCDVARLDFNADGNLEAAVALQRGQDGPNLLAFDAQARLLWSLYLGDQSGKRWPDCLPGASWLCRCLSADNLDGQSGDEIVAIANDAREYPTGMWIIDPRAGQVRATFWHTGQLAGVYVQRDFFAPGKAAIVAWGQNNKFDGFDELLTDQLDDRLEDPYPLTPYESVAVVMILNPDDMDGLGPPPTSRIGIPPAQPFAYAFLNMPASGTYVPAGGVKPTRPHASKMGFITGVRAAQAAAADGTGPWFEIHITHAVPEPGGWILLVDRNLDWRDAVPVLGETTHLTAGDWNAIWRPIIQNCESIRP